MAEGPRPGPLTWPGVKQLIRFERVTIRNGETRRTTTYAITSLPRERADAAFLLRQLRGRWQIESTFFVLDTQLREDACRVRTDQSPFVMSTIRHALLNTARRLHASPTALCEFYAAKTPALLQTFAIL